MEYSHPHNKDIKLTSKQLSMNLAAPMKLNGIVDGIGKATSMLLIKVIIG